MIQRLRFLLSPAAGRLAWSGVVALACLATGLVFFLPGWSELTPPDQGLLEQVASVFWRLDQPERYVGRTIDLYGTLWTFDFVARWLGGQVPTVNPEVFAPMGFDQGVTQGYAWLDGILALPLVRLLGIAAFYNLYILALVWINTLVLHLLYREAGASRVLSLGLAVATSLNGFTWGEIQQGRSTQAHWIFHALSLLFLVRLLRGRGRPWLQGLLSGACLAAACFVYWFGAIAVGLLQALAVAIHLLAFRPRKPVFLGGLVLGATTALLTIVPTWRLSSHVLGGGSSDWYRLRAIRTLDVPFLGTVPSYSSGLTTVEKPLDLWNAYVALGAPWPLLVAGLLTLILVWGTRRHLPWLVATLLLVTLPLGGTMVTMGRGWVTAMSLVEQVFSPMARCQVPGRMLVGPLLGLGMALASAAVTWEAWRHPVSRLLSLGLAVLLVWGAVPRWQGPLPTMDLEPEPIYMAAASRWPGGIIDVPLRSSASTYIQQIFHRQRLLGGPGVDGFTTRSMDHVQYCAANPVLKALEALGEGVGTPPEFALSDLDKLLQDGFTVVMVNPSSRAPYHQVAAFLGLPFVRSGNHAAIPLNPSAMDWYRSLAGLNVVGGRGPPPRPLKHGSGDREPPRQGPRPTR